MKRVIFTILFLFLFSMPAWAELITLEWDANSESDLAGYKIYWGITSGIYDNSVDVGNQTSYMVIELTEGQIYYFAVTAYDMSNNESGYSDELVYIVPVIDTTPPGVPQNLKRVIVEVTINEDGVRVVVEAN